MVVRLAALHAEEKENKSGSTRLWVKSSYAVEIPVIKLRVFGALER